MVTYKILDLYCGQGGAAMGYSSVGFDVTGVDIIAQPRYPFDFIQDDAIAYLAEHGHEFDAIHASPPCHDHTTLKSLTGLDGTGDLLSLTRQSLSTFSIPYVIENVMGAPMIDPVILCGSMFDLGADCKDGVYRQLRRHRQFELGGFEILDVPACNHLGQPVGVYGHGGTAKAQRGYQSVTAEARQALGVDWMTRRGMSQTLPPVYTAFIGRHLMRKYDGDL